MIDLQGKSPKILVIGDTIVDQYVGCDALGMSSEAPVLVVRELESKEYLGGAAIVASHVRALGAQCHYISVIGEDVHADYVCEKLKASDVETHFFRDESRPTTYKIRYMVESQKLFRVSRLKEHKISTKVEDFIIKNTSAIHALSEEESKLWSREIKKNKIYIIPNGVRKSLLFKKKYLKNKIFSICYCGRIAIFQKGLDLLLLAINELKKKNYRIYLNIIGDGHQKSKLEKMAYNLKIDDMITFHGNKIGNNKKKLIVKNDIFIHTSRFEGIPMAVLEAASLGMPLVISKNTNLSKFIIKANSGYVIKSLQIKHISETIEKIIKNRNKIKKMGINSRMMAIGNFSWKKIAITLNKKIYSQI